MYNSDWHIHTEASYDGDLSVRELICSAQKMGLTRFGITDHANYNSASFLADMKRSRKIYEENKIEGFYFGVELTPIAKPLYDFCAIHGTDEGYVPPAQDEPYEIAIALSLDEMKKLGIQYSVGAAHWVLNVPYEPKRVIREWHRQQMFLACDPRVDILGHPWWFWGEGNIWMDSDECYRGDPWFADFRVIPRSMHDELAAALKQNHVCIEANAQMILGNRYMENFHRQYSEYLRYMFEKGVAITFGSDSHGPLYPDLRGEADKILRSVGFKPEDFSSPVMHLDRG